MRVLLPAEKIIYEHWLINIVKPKKIKIVPTAPPDGFENHTPCKDSEKW